MGTVPNVELLDFATAVFNFEVIKDPGPSGGDTDAVSANPAMSDHRVTLELRLHGRFAVADSIFPRRDWPDCSQVHTAHRTR